MIAIPMLVITPTGPLQATPATLLFEDEFNTGVPGWTSIVPPYVYNGSVFWQYAIETGTFFENSNVFTDSATSSSSRTAPMLINDTVVPKSNFTYSVRMIAGDNDGCGLIFGYQNDNTFYRVTFCNENRAGWPYYGFNVDKMDGGEPTDLFGAGTPGYVPSFVYQFPVFPGHRPFDVTIGMTNGAFSLTVVDDPTNTAVIHNLVSSQPLPSYNDGKVGFFVWGMNETAADGLANVGIRYANASLLPTPLTGNTNPLAATWTTLVTPRGNGTTNVSATAGLGPIWVLPIGPTGPTGRLRNADGLFTAGDNSVAGSTNFAAASIVAGDVNWSNYVYSARFIPTDDDGFGMLLRYSSPSNWYRIAFRPQASATAGAKHGVSIQKNVNGVFDQVMHDATFNPSATLPMDVYASIATNQLTVLTVTSPGTPGQTANLFGPFNITGSINSAGKIGLFSWAQRSIDIDFVRVQAVAGLGLGVSSAYGNPDPPVGLNDIPNGTIVTATNASIVNDAPGVRRILTGWTGAGSVPSVGSLNSVTFTMTSISLLAWNYVTEYQLNVSATAGGTASYLGSQFLPEGTNITVTALNNPGYLFVGWGSNSISLTTNVALSMTRPINLIAKFATDSDGDGLPDDWELNYFGNLAQGAADNPDGDGLNNLAEYQQGSNPAFVETLVFSDGLSARWVNEQSDRALPGWFVVTNFGGGFRGVWENSNQNRAANDGAFVGATFVSLTSYGTNASFQGPLILVRSNVWDPNWTTNFSLQAEYSVGDNDGVCLYFRYLNESNWYRVTVCGELTTSLVRPLQGVTIQKRTNGWYSAVTPTSQSGNLGFFSDELDTAGSKRFRVTVNGTNDTFEVRTVAWNVLLNPPDWDTNNYELVQTFTDNSLSLGRIGVGSWGMAAGRNGWNATTNNPNDPGVLQNPVGSGMFVDNIVLKSPAEGPVVFGEDWETAPQLNDFPAGWENPYTGIPGFAGDWHVTAHGTLANLNNVFGTTQTGTAQAPKTDAEGPTLSTPALTNGNYILEVGIHPLDDGGIGFVYDFKDTNNFARVLFDSQVPNAGQLPQGLNVSRKSGGVWTDIAVGDTAFIYTPGRRFDVRFANNNGVYTLLAWNTDDPATVYRWQWTDQPAAGTNRVGLAVWNMPDAHFTYFRASGLPTVVTFVPFKITQISLAGGNVTLDVLKPAGSNYHVLRATNVVGPYITNAASQSGAQYTEPAPVGGSYFYRLQLLP